jgi:uncharacterized protein DUF2637
MKDTWHRWLKTADSVALAAMGIIGSVITGTAFTESYSNLYDYALLVGIRGWRARIAPLGVDLLILTGELLLFVAIARGWERRTKVYGWCLVIAGAALSVGGNVGHLHQAGWQTRLVSAFWPTVLTVGLAAWLMALKRVSESYQPKAQQKPATAPAPHRARKPARPKRAATGRPPLEVPLPEGALAAAVAQNVSRRDFRPWLAENYGTQVDITPWKAGQLLNAARSANGHQAAS